MLSPSFAQALFDVDGTLVQSIEQVQESWEVWSTEYGFSPTIFRHGQTATSALEAVLPTNDIPGALRRLTEIEIDLSVSVRACPGALDLLTSIPVGRWGVVTSARRAVAEARLAAAGIRIPRVLVSGDDVRLGKPSPDCYARARSLLGWSGRCVAFEDTSAGAIAARGAECFTVGVTGIESVTTLSHVCDVVVRDLTQVHLELERDAGSGFILRRSE
jgi:mannitol-1-/sugar-/sorbitol-6-phosphatase